MPACYEIDMHTNSKSAFKKFLLYKLKKKLFTDIF